MSWSQFELLRFPRASKLHIALEPGSGLSFCGKAGVDASFAGYADDRDDLCRVCAACLWQRDLVSTQEGTDES